MGEGQGQPMGEGKPMGQGKGKPMPSPLGTGFVPMSPRQTAEQIAGAEALAQAEKALGEPLGKPMPGGPIDQQASAEGQPSESPSEAEGEGELPQDAASKTAKSGSRNKGTPMENEKQPPGDLQVEKSAEGKSEGDKDQQDADAAKRKFEADPWFAKLPPSLRSAIQSKSRNKAPRGYEERLKRYFESID